MINKNIMEIVQMVSGDYSGVRGAFNITGVTINSKAVVKGNLFIPIIGEKFNGHEFVKDAINNGAKASLWQRSQPSPPVNIPLIYVDDTLLALQDLAKNYLDQLSVKVIGITGSNGKTTTKDIVASVVGTTYKVQKTEGNLNNHYGLPLTILQLEEDTDIAVLEMGMSSKGEIELLSKLARPEAAIITNIGEAHLLDLGSREGIAEAKLEIVEGLKDDGILIYNGDEPLLNERLAGKKIHKVSFGSRGENDYIPTAIKQENDGTYFTINKTQNNEFFIPILGRHNVFNTLAAVAVARYFNVTWENIDIGLKKLTVTTMRLEVTEGKNGLKIINDAYNASPTSMIAAIDLIRDVKGYSKKLIVFGDMLELGPNEVKFHEQIGKSLNPEIVDYVYTFGELATHIAEAARGSFDEGRVKAFTDKSLLIEAVLMVAASNDIILIKGSRGMKLEEVATALKK